NGPAGDRLSRSHLRGDDGGSEITAALRVPDEERADLSHFGAGFGGYGVLLRQYGGTGRYRDRDAQRGVRRSYDRKRRTLRREADRGRGRVGRALRSEQARG